MIAGVGGWEEGNKVTEGKGEREGIYWDYRVQLSLSLLMI